MNIVVRNETEKDYRAVEEVTREAFWNLYVPGCNEHYLAHIMREHADFIKELSFVAERDGKVVGSIMYSRAWLIDESGKERQIVSFGPLSVLPAYQRKGIGSALIGRTVDIARDKGIDAIVILGDPHNYCKHGFKCARDLNISDMNGDHPHGMLCLELRKGALAGHRWKFKYSDVFNAISDEEAEKFDKTFPHKEKGYCYTQDIFSIAFRSFVR